MYRHAESHVEVYDDTMLLSLYNLCVLCVSVVVNGGNNRHRDTENTEVHREIWIQSAEHH